MRSFFRQANMSVLPTLIVLAVTIFVLSIINPAEAQSPAPTVLYSFQQDPTDATVPWGAIAQENGSDLHHDFRYPNYDDGFNESDHVEDRDHHRRGTATSSSSFTAN